MEGRDGERASSLVEGRDINGCFLIKLILKILIQNENSRLFFHPGAAGRGFASRRDAMAVPARAAGPSPQQQWEGSCAWLWLLKSLTVLRDRASPDRPCWG